MLSTLAHYGLTHDHVFCFCFFPPFFSLLFFSLLFPPVDAKLSFLLNFAPGSLMFMSSAGAFCFVFCLLKIIELPVDFRASSVAIKVSLRMPVTSDGYVKGKHCKGMLSVYQYYPSG